MIKTIKIIATVSAGGTLTVQVPPDIRPGDHWVVLVIEEEPAGEREAYPFDFPIDDCGPWPEGLSLRREDMYGDCGR